MKIIMKISDRTKQASKLTCKINIYPERYIIRISKVSLVQNTLWYIAGGGNLHNATIPEAAITLIK